MLTVNVDSDDKSTLALNLQSNVGNNIQFSNGCWVSLKVDNGLYLGECPYGLIWGCNSSGDFVKSIINWVEYWDVPRTETGALVVIPLP
jgi:hypothetical protein